MTTITVVVPTISGREEMLAWILDCYRDRTPGHELQLITPKDHPNWPTACNSVHEDVRGEYVLFGADDLEPVDGWANAMIGCLSNNELPAPQIWDFKQGGAPVNEAHDGPPGTITAFTRVPGMTRDMMVAIGPWPEIDYYADNWVSDKARTIGIPTRVTEGFAFVHHWNQVGRLDAGDWVGRNEPLYQAELEKLRGGGLTIKERADMQSPGTIVLPVGGHTVEAGFAMDMLHLVGSGGLPEGSHIGTISSGSVVMNLNATIHDMPAEHQWAWVMNDDQRFRPDLLVQLLEHDKPITVPLCTRRVPPYGLTIAKAEDEIHDERSGRTYPGWQPYRVDEVPDDLFEVAAAGGAGMLIRREVLDTISYPYFESSDGVYLNEDYEFSRRVRELGFEIWCDPHAYLGHITDAVVWPSRLNALEAMRSGKPEGMLAIRIDHGGAPGQNEVLLDPDMELVQPEEAVA